MIRKARQIDRKAATRLSKLSKRTRRDVLRMIQNAGSGNPGSALSSVEIITWLLMHEMRVDPQNPKWMKRDRLILSKGHSVPVFYSLCVKYGWVKEDELMKFRQFNTRLQTHPDYNTLDCIDYSSGSLGQGLSAANGMALAANHLNLKEVRFFVLLGDGEIQEGQIWEAAMTAGNYDLENIIAIIDRNRFQQDGEISRIIELEPLKDKWISFNWQVAEADGHNFFSLYSALEEMRDPKPKLIIANTIKGKGVSFMEERNEWHTGGEKFTKKILMEALSEIGD